MRVYPDLSKVLKHGKRLLSEQCTCSNCERQAEEKLTAYEQECWNMAKSIMRWLFIFGVVLMAGCLLSGRAHAYTDQEAVRTIVGEASNQGYIGMLAVAEVIRHSSSLKGFYGLKAKHSDHESKLTWDMARMAWEASKTSNVTEGANHFENIKAFGCPSWVRKCVETFRYRDHVFYKEV